MVKVLDYHVEVNKFELCRRYYVYIHTNTLGESYELPLAMG